MTRPRSRRGSRRPLPAQVVTASLLLLTSLAALADASAPPKTPETATTSATSANKTYTLGDQLAQQLAEATEAAQDRALTPQQRDQVAQGQQKLDRLWQRLPSTVQRPFSWTDGSNIAAVVLSVAVSLTSSVDRQGGASLYVAIFAVLLRFRMRQAVALTSLTVFLGSLAPCVAAFCDPHLTERGVLALPDLPGALVVLPAMYFGLSWGVIVNSLLPEWLLTLLVVFILFTSAVELAIATARVLAARRQMVVLWDRLRCELARSRGEPPPPPMLTAAERRERRREERARDKERRRRAAPERGQEGGLAGAGSGASSVGAAAPAPRGSSFFAAFRSASKPLDAAKVGAVAEDDVDVEGRDAITADCTAASGSGSGTGGGVNGDNSKDATTATTTTTTTTKTDRPLSPAERDDRAAALARARETARRLRHLRRRAEEAEAIALIYPAFHVPTVKGALADAAKKGVQRRWTAEGGGGEEAAAAAAAAVAVDDAAFCPERAAAELLAGEGDGREQDVAAVLARLGPVTGADALLRGGGVGGGGVGGAPAAAAAAPSTAPTAAPAAAASPAPPPSRLTPKKLWHLQNKFELFLLLKVIVIHLVTEAIRHHTAKPCTSRFWIMLGGFAGAVTLLLFAVVASYARRRLWRGPHWLDGREQVIVERRARARRSDVEGAAAAAGTAAAGGETGAKEDDEEHQPPPPPPKGCWAKFSAWRRGHSPFVPLPANQAITRLDACNATDGYRCWTRERIVGLSFLSLPIGVFSSCAGMAGGPIQAQLLLLLKLKPHVVAGTSRVMLSAFTLGTAVAYAVSGNLQLNYGLVFGVGNLVIAPLGLLLFKRLRLPTWAILFLSLAMGLLSVGVLVVRRLAPELSLVAAALRGHVVLPPDERFTMSRFCKGNY